jgi:transcriptional regulator
MELPMILNGLTIEEPTEEDIEYLMKKVPQKIQKKIVAKNIRVFVSEEKRYFVVATLMKIMENDLGLFEVPLC